MKRPDGIDAPGKSLDALPPTRLHTRSEEQEQTHLTSQQREALGAVYQLLSDVAQRVQDDGRIAA